MVYIYAFLGRLALYPYLLYRLSRCTSEGSYRWIYRAFVLEFALSTLALLVHHFIMHSVMSLIMSAGLFIFFSIGYVAGGLITIDLLAWRARRLGLGPKLSSGGRQRLQRVSALLGIGLFFGTVYVGYHNVRDLHVERRTLQLPREGSPRHLRLVLATDIHIGEGITHSYVERIVNAILAEHPDVILIGGDYIDHYSKYAYQPEMMQTMSRLKARDGVFYVPGNHEYRADSTAKLDWVSLVGGTLLRDSIVYPDSGSYALIGRDDYVQKSRQSLQNILDHLKPHALTIMLEHTPEQLDSLEGSPIDLALYGHTHGGQLFPNHIPVWLRYGITSGSKQVGATEVYVSSGAGSAGAPYRIGTRSEIVVYDIDY